MTTRFTRVYWGTVAVLALLGLLWRLAYIGWRDYLPVRVAVDCGEEQMQSVEGFSMARRDCLWQAYQAGRTARLVVHETTVFGPEVTTLTVAGPERIRIRREVTDQQGRTSSDHQTCEQLALHPDPHGPAFFYLSGCTSEYGVAGVGSFSGFSVRGG